MSIDTLAYTEQLKSELGDAVTFFPMPCSAIDTISHC